MVRIYSLLICWLGLLISVHASALPLDEIRTMALAGRGGEALRSIDAYVRANPNDTQAEFLRGVLLAENNRSKEALIVFRKLTQDHPELPEPHNNLAVLYASHGEYVKARDALLVAINTHPSYATAHENLGDIYAKMAGIAYDQALQFDRANDAAKAKLNLVRNLFSISQQNIVTTGTPVPAPDAVPPAASVEPDPADAGTVAQTINAWAGSWSAQEVEFYLSFYGKNFTPGTGVTRQEWEHRRRARLSKPKFIDIGIQQLRVSQPHSRRATATFVQVYRSDSFADQVKKTLVLELQISGWKIVAEETAN